MPALTSPQSLFAPPPPQNDEPPAGPLPGDRSAPLAAPPAPLTRADIPAPREQLKIVIVGHVDHGKSTFVGRLFHDTGSLPEGKLEQLKLIAERRGVPFEWANLMDALQSERDQNITIDTAQIWFQTPKRQYVIIDAPGHKEFLKNMVTGAANAEAALLLIDAYEGIQENSRRHGYLLHLLGIRQLAVLVNKMDLENYSQERFAAIETEYRAWLSTIGLHPTAFVPIVARDGDNIASPSPNMPWWHGPRVVDVLDQFHITHQPAGLPLRFPVQDVYRFDHRRILAGRVESGTLRVGDKLSFCPGGKTSTVRTIERWNARPTDTAHAGESVGITLTEQIFVARGAVAAHEAAPPYELSEFKARLFWLGKAPLVRSRTYKLKLLTQEVECSIHSIDKIIDASTLESVAREGEPSVRRHEVAELTIHTKRPLAFDAHSELPISGRFVLVDGYDVAGGGIVAEHNYPRRSQLGQTGSENIFWTRGKVTSRIRELRNGHNGCVVWLTGVPGSGKSTIAAELEGELFNLGRQVYVLEADNVRDGLGSDLGLSPEDCAESVRRVGEVAKLFADAGIICIAAFVSRRQADRDLVRKSLPPGRFIEVYLKSPDDGGQNVDAKAAGVPGSPGTDEPYERPPKPELELRTDQLTVSECVTRIIDFLQPNDPSSEISI